MTDFIEIHRKFRDLAAAGFEDTEDYAFLGSEYTFGQSIGWSELLKYPRVILLAEAGSGKTIEMGEQVKRLQGEGRFAFFAALESLDSEPFACLLSSSEHQRFGAWKASSNEPAWFFLDAVDELKLKQGTLDGALRHLSKAIDSQVDRARVIISCRPSDWRPSVDLATFLNRLPAPEEGGGTISRGPDEVFIKALRRDLGISNAVIQEDGEFLDRNTVRKVAMLPMTNDQIHLFAQHFVGNNAAAFLSEVDKENAWGFARRPLDLSELIATWTDSGHLGSRAQQHEANATAKLKDQPDRPGNDVLTDVQARCGAERLALAHALTRTQTIRSPEQALDIDRADSVLESERVLPDWNEAERKALLRRGLFDPATYGRVRFHHRSVQEYLAARRLRWLQEQGMAVKARLRLFFAEKYGVKVVVPSMRPIAAWLALWDDAVRGELIKREPETLLSLGDPGTLALGTRSELVRTFVAAYGEGGRRGLKIPTDAVRRLSRPELAPVIRECWGNGPENDEVREFLLDMIWLGAVDDCTDLARGAAREPDWPSSQRITAILALLACGRDATVRELAAAMLTEPAFWPDEIVHGVASNLFPGIITVEELATLMERSNEPQETADGFDWAARQIARAIEPWSEAAVALRDKLADLIWHEGAPSQEPYHMSGRFDHLVQALAILCDRQLSTCSQNPQADLIHACVVASRFGDRQTGAHEPLGHLRARFKSSASLRREYLWAELAFMGETTPSGDDQTALYFVQHFGLTGRLTEADRPWIEAALADDSHTERHPGSLHAWIQIWSQGERAASELCDMQRILNDNPYLVQILNEHTALQVRNNEIEKMKRYSREEAAADTDRETERLGTWRKWRDDMLADPVVAFSAEKRAATVSNLYAWLSASHQDRNRFNVWDKQALREAFGTDIAERAEQTFRGLWRTNELPVLWSARPIADRNETPYDWIYGLLGVSAESSTGGWTNSLSPDEARRAAVCATIELNGFAPFIANLAVSHPKEVEEMIGGEVSAELGIGDHHDSLPVLQNLTYANGDLKRLLTSRLLAELQSLPHTFTEETGPRWAYHLDQILRILNESGGVAEREAIAQKCVDRYEADPFSTVSLTWLQGLFRFDPLRGTQVLISRLASGNDTATREHATRAFASLFRGRDVGVFEIADPAQHARALEQLVRYAYSFIHPRDDQHQQGAYSPDLRDDAQSARNFLLSRLLDTPGREAWSVIRSLADAADFAHLSDHLHLRARQRAAADAEFAPFEPEAVVALEKRLEVPPHDRDGLFAVMLDRLNDLAYDLLHDDFTDRQTLKGVTEELEMQRILAQRIKTRANGAYKVTREEEVADQKRIDIRLLAINGDQKVAVEVKIADNWSLTRLEQALRNQLVGQYLRHNNCKAGCLLLTYNGEKGYWIHAETRKHVKFPEIIKLLNDKAQALQEEKLHDVRISVFGLDLTDPVLVSAHPAS